jgi:hypothetical protein
MPALLEMDRVTTVEAANESEPPEQFIALAHATFSGPRRQIADEEQGHTDPARCHGECRRAGVPGRGRPRYSVSFADTSGSCRLLARSVR